MCEPSTDSSGMKELETGAHEISEIQYAGFEKSIADPCEVRETN